MRVLQTIQSELRIAFSYCRLSRLRFLFYTGLSSLLSFIIEMISTFIIPEYPVLPTVALLGIKVILTFFWAAFLLMSIWWQIGRMHDIGMSITKWIMLLSCSITCLIVVFLAPSLEDWILTILFVLGVTGILVFFCMCIAIFFIPGEKAENKYGSIPPKNNWLVIAGSILYVIAFVIIIFASSTAPFLNQDLDESRYLSA